MVKLLLDENITPVAAVMLAAEGADVYHVRDRGLLGITDPAFERAYEEDCIVVTSNVGDFEDLVRARELHAGVALLEAAGLRRDEQIALLRNVVAAIAEHGAMVNEILRVAADESMTFEAAARR